MKFLFIVQGEGRGHMTQAITLSNILRNAGHDVVEVLIGKSARREVPGFFYSKIGAPVTPIESPNFLVDSKNKKIKISSTILYNLIKLRTFIRSLKTIHSKVKSSKPDVIVNFYDLLAGIYVGVYKPKVKFICIGHQYLLLHPEFHFPRGHRSDKIMLRVNTWLASLRAQKYLALSFKQMVDIPEKKIYVVPPLLREELKSLEISKEGFIHGYMLNSGYAEDIERWHNSHPDITIHFFWDRKDVPKEYKVKENLVYHQIDDVKFLDYMRRCDGYSSTAGFESICEAMYLGKPIMMVPTYGHFEQLCNAHDAVIAGAGIHREHFDLTALLEYIPHHKDITLVFRNWADSSTQKFLQLLTND